MNWITEIYKLIPEDEISAKVVLGSLMYDINRVELIQFLKPEMFGIIDGVNERILFTELIEYAKDNRDIKPTVFVNYLEGKQVLPNIGERNAVLKYYAKAESDPVKFVQYAKEICDNWKKKYAILHAVELIKVAHLPGGNIDEVLAKHEKEIQAISEQTTTIEVNTLPPEVEPFIKRINERVTMNRAGIFPGLLTGIRELDEAVRGVRESDFVVIGARSGMGKTSLMRSIVRNITARGEPALIFSMEETKEQWVDKLVSLDAHIDYKQIRDGDLNDTEIAIVNSSVSRVAKWPIYIVDKAKITVDEMRIISRLMIRKYGIKSIWSDYIQKTQIPGRQSKVIELGHVAADHKAMAKDFKVPQFALAQLNRNPESREDKTPRGGDIRDSDQIFQEADLVILPFRPEHYGFDTFGPSAVPAKDLAVLFIPKARDVGDIKPVFSKFDPTNAEFKTFNPILHEKKVNRDSGNGFGFPDEEGDDFINFSFTE